MTTRPVPSPEDLIALIQASVRNASELLEAARLLLAAGHVPRAHALATLALEEIGKSHLCILASGLVPIPGGATYTDEKTFWETWRAHPAKLFWALSFLRMVICEPDIPLDEAAARIEDEARAEHLRKLRGIYVDFEDGAVRLPSEITTEAADRLIAEAAVVVAAAEARWCSDGARERALEILGRPPGFAEMTERIGQVLAADPDAAFETGRKVFTDAMSDVLPATAQGAPQ
jgi:AbiV family abortive infection protein